MNARVQPVAIAEAKTGPIATHEVRNQARPPLGFNAFDGPLHAPTETAIGNTVTCFSGTEITLDNERDTNPVLNEAAQYLQAGYGLLEWPALRRKLDRIDGGYAR